MNKILLAPSILSANFACLGKDINKVLSAGADLIHFDVMDNHYVDNLTIGPMVLKSLRDYNITAPIDVHIMAKPVNSLIPKFAKAGANFITIHPESTEHIDYTLQLIRDCGCKAGLALNPSTPINFLEYVMDKLDLILLMSVNPGFGGQSFIPSTLNKLKIVKKKISKGNYDIFLEVDGGINIDNINDVILSGANILVMGSAIFNNINVYDIVKKIKLKLNNFYKNI
ncbi:ribulose-phosphate 3-epimerase [Buchnera aphidicola]|uniref:ribulose-phosphate 3-epimerase n=1 Tax=Buchnera aphidicola TaxID=9 RepID=UPI0031B89EE8